MLNKQIMYVLSSFDPQESCVGYNVKMLRILSQLHITYAGEGCWIYCGSSTWLVFKTKQGASNENYSKLIIPDQKLKVMLSCSLVSDMKDTSSKIIEIN